MSFAPTIFEDLARRDFTINAIAWDMITDQINDPHGGRQDLAKRIIRAIGDPAERFHEDGLRPLRACRFAAQLSFTVDDATQAAIPGALDVLSRVSAERVRDELLKTLDTAIPSVGLLLMHRTGILGVILPELEEGVGVTQGSLHCYDVFTHGIAACDAAPRSSLELRLAALLHDIGKPRVRQVQEDGRITFYTHDALSAELSEQILLRLKLPTTAIRQVVHLIRNHMFNYQEEWTDAAVRRLIARVGEQNIDDLVALRRADQIGMCRENADVFPQGLADFIQRVKNVRQGDQAFTIRQLAVSGDDIIERLALQPGPQVGMLLQSLLQAVLDDPAMNEREKLLDIAQRLYRERLAAPPE